jgi:hypothetical protein
MSLATPLEAHQAMSRPTSNSEAYAWWNSLRHHRLLLSGTALHQCFAGSDPAPLHPKRVENIAYAYRKFQLEPTAESLSKWLEIAVHEAIGNRPEGWTKGSSLGSSWVVKGLAGESIRPRWVWQADTPDALPLFVTEGARSIGVGRGRRDHARILDWLRAQKRDLAIVTNGKQWRIVFATETTDAWCESDVEQWFADSGQGLNLTALRLLLSESGILTLREAISETRKGHAELSRVLGERVRQAVEVLVEGSQKAIDDVFAQPDNPVRLEHVYQAATRVAMRLVVVMFAESRQLLSSPSLSATRDAYWDSYSLQRLRLLLEQETLTGDRANTAWPRILALFNLLYKGSSHKDLTRRAYGGRLFEPGDPNSSDPILRALAAFERTDRCPTDRQVHEALKLMAYAPVKLRQGRAATWSVLPVDFSQLDVEYVGILYEGLLDYELHRVGVNEPVVFLNVGVQPVLPLSRLEQMSDAALKEMVKELSKKEKAGSGEEEAEEAEEDEVEDEEDSEDVDETIEPEPELEQEEAEPEIQDDAFHVARTRALAWAKRAVVAAGIVKKPRGKNPNTAALQEATQRAARGLISRIAVPGELYLVRHGGTRKGSGTFYTKPQLAEPTVARTLEPLVYEGEVPRDPETVLAVKVCDPACGSGSFLVSSLRYLTRSLFESISAHGWIIEHPDGRISWEDPQNARPSWFKEALRDFRGLNERPEALFGQTPREKVEAQLLRVVAERCVYGVDLNPLAVELAKLSLWIATMDPNLRFSFLDHKIKVGNGLVGCWFDRFQDYPVLAWMREGGDKSHGTSVHHRQGTWTRAIAAKREEVKREMRMVLSGQSELFELPMPPEAAHQEAVATYEQLHAKTQDPNGQSEAYQAWRSSPGFQSLKDAFDAWCALWFWPADQLDLAPMPRTFGNLSKETRAAVRQVAEANQFFHWELEFPDVFDGENSGFTAMLGNPPWENHQINPLEWFSNYDPLFRTYGRVQGQGVIRDLFRADTRTETAWIRDNSGSKSLANWIKSVGYAESQTKKPFPFRLQMGRVFTYRLFLEQCLFLLKSGGRLGQIVPSAIYSDAWSAPLRKHMLLENQWEWLFGFENRNKVFDIDSRFKFCPVVVQKGGTTVEVQTAFMRRELDDWSRPERFAIGVTREQIARFSPKSMAFLEVQDERDVRVLEKMTANGIPLGDDGPDGWGVKYALEFMMNTDAKLFPPREKWEARGFRPDEYGHWLLGDWVPVSEAPAGAFDSPGWVKSRDGNEAIAIDAIEEVALPLYEGRMIGQFDFSQKGWVSGKGRTAVWRDIPWEAKQIEPQYLMSLKSAAEGGALGLKLPVMNISSSTNARTMFASIVAEVPCNHSVNPIRSKSDLLTIALSAVFNSFCTDGQLRLRLSGLNVSFFVLDELVVPLPTVQALRLVRAASSLGIANKWFAEYADRLDSFAIALTESERLRIRCILDATVAHLFGLDRDDYCWILRDCDHPVAQSTNKAFTRALDAKGFWRVDKAQPPELRHTVLAQVAFDDLQALIAQHGEEEGMKRFLGSGPDDGWMLPETLRLADYGLGRDDRAQQPQPVASALGPRFYDWQLKQTPEEAWAETQRHAENLRRIRAVGIEVVADGDDPDDHDELPAKDLFGGTMDAQPNLFGS